MLKFTHEYLEKSPSCILEEMGYIANLLADIFQYPEKPPEIHQGNSYAFCILLGAMASALAEASENVNKLEDKVREWEKFDDPKYDALAEALSRATPRAV